MAPLPGRFRNCPSRLTMRVTSSPGVISSNLSGLRSGKYARDQPDVSLADRVAGGGIDAQRAEIHDATYVAVLCEGAVDLILLRAAASPISRLIILRARMKETPASNRPMRMLAVASTNRVAGQHGQLHTEVGEEQTDYARCHPKPRSKAQAMTLHGHRRPAAVVARTRITSASWAIPVPPGVPCSGPNCCLDATFA